MPPPAPPPPAPPNMPAMEPNFPAVCCAISIAFYSLPIILGSPPPIANLATSVFIGFVELSRSIPTDLPRLAGPASPPPAANVRLIASSRN